MPFTAKRVSPGRRWMVWGVCLLALGLALTRVPIRRPQREPKRMQPVDTVIIPEKWGDRRFQSREEWIEMRHRAAPGVNWRAVDQATRIEKYRSGLDRPGAADGGALGTWIELGSRDLAGRIHCADYDPVADLLYCASSGGNVWRSSLDGGSWTCLNDRLQMRDIVSLRLLRSGSKRRIVVGSQSAVYYTDDEGGRWAEARGLDGSSSGVYLKRLVMANDAQHTLYALGEELDGRDQPSLYRSTDGGGHFSPIAVFTQPDQRNISCFDIWTDRYGDGTAYLVENANIHRIRGSQLTRIASYPRSLEGPTFLSGRQAGAGTFLYVLVNQNGKSQIFGSDGTAINWTYRGFLTPFPFMLNSFECSLNPDRLYLGWLNGFWSGDGGASWTQISEWWEYYANPSGRLHADICGVNVVKDASGAEITLLSTDGGIYVSTDGGLHVNNISLANLNVSQYYSHYSRRQDPGTIYAGSQDQGYQVGRDGRLGGAGEFTQVISGDYGNLTSSDGGETVWSVYPGMTLYMGDDRILAITPFPFSYHMWLPPLMADPEDPACAYLGGGRIAAGAHLYHLKYDSGRISYTELPFNFSPENDELISALACSPINPAYRYVLNSGNDFFRSTDGGKTWTRSSAFHSPDRHNLYGSGILPSPVRLGRVYVCGSGYSGPPVLVSDDNGKTFTAFGTGLPDTLVNRLATDEDESVIYAATEVGPYAFINGSWTDISNQRAPGQAYTSVEVLPGENSVRFATYGRGIWEYRTGKNCRLSIRAGAGGSTDPAPGAYVYSAGNRVRVAATPDANHEFAGWSGSVSSTQNPVTITMNGDQTVEAAFRLKPALTVEAGEGGTTDPAPGTHYHPIHSVVTLTALPDPVWEFAGWTGSFASPRNPVTVTMDGDQTARANFRFIAAPVATGRKLENRSWAQVEYVNLLTWQANPANQGLSIAGYRIYDDRSPRVLVGEVDASQTGYRHRRQGPGSRTYAIVAVTAGGREGAAALVTVPAIR